MNDLTKNIIAISIGGAIGTTFRYIFNIVTLETGYPLGTIIENLGGSFLLGFLTAWFIVFKPKEWVKTGLGVGLCGGFTTMSTFAADSVLLYSVHIYNTLIYVVISLFGGVVCALAGSVLGTAIAKRKLKTREGGLKS
ncbi:CrcB family protein [Alkalihalophilus marmarensis]|jgi:CrcB protein|uniref:Fluoride-specific ion channel FluC n=1 Tax=Alkalihalophilus marmarensis DSM 21297 TaxID=1188261 RepID=U6STE2_9BACI|nr:CrcB family protein [Alkalihalophilus marmarensis]ERN54652.1 chromosome condensation protein CrcB [Alkalihalophilus marmarensis DSM 21297]MCM3488728.1 CrcB family protein [Alkalihalophilus marmarensis]